MTTPVWIFSAHVKIRCGGCACNPTTGETGEEGGSHWPPNQLATTASSRFHERTLSQKSKVESDRVARPASASGLQMHTHSTPIHTREQPQNQERRTQFEYFSKWQKNGPRNSRPEESQKVPQEPGRHCFSNTPLASQLNLRWYGPSDWQESWQVPLLGTIVSPFFLHSEVNINQNPE